MRKVKLIFNPASDRGRSGQKASDLQAIVETLGGATWAGTEYPGHAIELAATAGAEGFDVVVAMGGDGTVHEVVNGLMRTAPEKRPMLGCIPIGSGNDFAYCSQVDFNPQEGMRRIFSADPVLVDLAHLTDNHGRSIYMDNTCGMLFVASVNIQSRKIRRIYGFAMYLTAVVKSIIENYQTTHFKMTVDGTTSDHDLIVFSVGNGNREGGGFYTCPSAKNNDGILNFVMAPPISRLTMFRLLPEFMKGTQGKFDFVRFGEFKHLVIEADRAVPIHVDGELWAPYEADVRRIEMQILPAALKLVR
jgi:YegS/Rv2252/BmrU family lipid kinase